MLTTYILELKNEFLKQKNVKDKKSLQTGKWNKGSYNLLSKLIQQKLDVALSEEQKSDIGTTLSSRTLYNIFELKRKINIPLDRRAHTTLNKMAIFAEYESWDKFALHIDLLNSKGGNTKKAIKKEIKHLILKAKQSEFLIYHQLPKADLNPLKEYYHLKGSAYKEIKSNINTLQNNKLIISNPYNPSSIEVIDVKIKSSSIKEGSYVVNTKEYWLLCWYNEKESKFTKRQRRLEKHKYVVIQDKKGHWKIDTNASINGVIEPSIIT